MNKTFSLASVALALCAVGSESVLAQETPAATNGGAAASDDSGLQEVLVTARRQIGRAHV